jgi:hypothetical protein
MGSGKLDSGRPQRFKRAPARALALLLCMGAGAAAAESISVTMDQAKLVRLPEGTATIVVGNPAIADVSMQRNGVVVITGRRAGRTNFIALDRKGAIISESTVAVGLSNEGRVLVRRGLESTSYDCQNECLPAGSFGDDEKSFAQTLSQGEARAKEAREAAKAGR